MQNQVYLMKKFMPNVSSYEVLYILRYIFNILYINILLVFMDIFPCTDVYEQYHIYKL